MQINAELFFEKIDNYKLNKNFVLVSGNEPSFINKIENLIIGKVKSIESSELIIIDFKVDKNPNFEEILCGQSLFNEQKILHIKNPSDAFLKNLETMDVHNNTIIINGENLRNNSKIKNYFKKNKGLLSVVCYKLSGSFKKKIIDSFLNKNKFALDKDAYWYLVETSSDEYLLLEKELEKISNFNNKISLQEIQELLTNHKKMQLDELFIKSLVGKSNEIIKNSEMAISSSAEAYTFIQLVKTYCKILVATSEKKTNNDLESLTNTYLPRYLFMHKNNFKKIIEMCELNKIIKINELIQKTEILLRKNDSRYLIILQRFLLNFKKLIKK